MRGNITPSAPRSSARPARMRSGAATRTSRCTPAARRLQLRERGLLAGGSVLEVDEHPVEAGQAARLGGRRRAEHEEGADERLARRETLAHGLGLW